MLTILIFIASILTFFFLISLIASLIVFRGISRGDELDPEYLDILKVDYKRDMVIIYPSVGEVTQYFWFVMGFPVSLLFPFVMYGENGEKEGLVFRWSKLGQQLLKLKK